ncbi:uncharacterized protein LOC121948526 [Plectropomus leopardus]|uniref:uncharacterized protein LOC121948526 n=1 Tax=Plectropomus leopardus TaxID=160734 RepID=UPI001C4C080F|nr:uncharacterized protein LOC121948526 [Plectropomus leopardus]
MAAEEEEALKNYCRRMISRAQNKQQHLQSSEEDRRRQTYRGARRRTDRERHVKAGDELRDDGDSTVPLPDYTPRDHQTPPCLTRQGPEVQPVPLQLLSMLRLKTLNEDMRRAAEVELHDPAVCSECVEEKASLALRSFIRRKTQLQFPTLKGRLNTHLSCGECAQWGSLCKSAPMPLTGFGRNYLVEMCGSQQPGVALATTKERGVTLATDEMRGYPDKNATGTHLARPRCPFSDR